MVRIALVQHSTTGDREANRARGLAAIAEAAGEGADLVAFAELSFDPFWPRHPATPGALDVAESIPGPTSRCFADAARQYQVVVIPNLFERDGDHTFDSSVVIESSGEILGVTRMIHITEYAGFHEQGYYSPGDRGAPVYQTSVGSIGICICYDRHYPEYLRALAMGGADLVIVPQAGALGEWPDGLYEAEMRVAAFQHGFAVALVNRVGVEHPLEFAGESFVCDAEGKILARGPRQSEAILYCDLDLSENAHCPARRLFLRDRRPDLYRSWLDAEQR